MNWLNSKLKVGIYENVREKECSNVIFIKLN